jgi:hypothetical protein
VRAVELCSYRWLCGGMDRSMKTFRVLGAIFIVLGFIFALLGILTSLFPMIENEHFQVILNSFQETSADSLTNALNAIVLFCLHSSYYLLLCGIFLMVAGGLISSSARKRQIAPGPGSAPQRVSPPASEPLGIPKPAYYPGGLAPPAADFNYGKDAARQFPQADDAPDFGFHTAKKAGPILGGVEPSFSSDENDAQKLMQHDQLLTSRKQTETPGAPEYARYLSNAAPEEAGAGAVKTETQADGDPLTADDGSPRRPRIVSTMGKRKA